MARAIWSGAISFGLVNIPVKLYGAVKDKNVRFHLLHEKDSVRVRQRLWCPGDDEEVTLEDIVKGYEVAPDQYVVVRPEELEALAPRASRAIEILDFVDISEIDPVYYERPYFLLPDEQGARAYVLLVRALKESGRVGIGKFVMRDKEYLAALRPLGDAICLETMHFADEVLQAESIEPMPEVGEAGERELKMARQLIDSLSGDFEPEKYHNDYRESVMDLVSARAEGQEYTMPAAVEEPGKVIDLMAALEASLKSARGRAGARKTASAGKKPARKSGARKTASSSARRKAG